MPSARLPSRVIRVLVLGVTLACAAGCSSVRASALRTGTAQFPAYSGPVAIYALGEAPAGAVDLGVVEVHATQSEGTLDILFPKFVEKVAEIGGDIAVVDGMRAHFELVGRARFETFYYTCGMGATCAGTRMYNATDELMTVAIFGHAFRSNGALPAPPKAPAAPPPQPATDDVSASVGSPAGRRARAALSAKDPRG